MYKTTQNSGQIDVHYYIVQKSSDEHLEEFSRQFRKPERSCPNCSDQRLLQMALKSNVYWILGCLQTRVTYHCC